MPNLTEVPPFKLFASSVYERWTGEWKDGFFVIKSGGAQPLFKPQTVMVLGREEAHDLIDALQKFVAMESR